MGAITIQHLNKGRVDLLLSCSWRYWRQYCSEEDEGGDVFAGAGAAFLGSVLHNALEEFYNGETTKKAELMKMYDLENEKSPLHAEGYIEGRNILEQWYEKVYTPYLDESGRKTIGSEVQFGYSPRHDTGEKMTVAGVPIHGYIDRVDELIVENRSGTTRILEVVDYKSNRMPKPRVEIDDPFNAEVNIYLLAARKLYPGYDEYVFVYDMLRWGLYKTTRDVDTLKDYARFLRRVQNYGLNIEKPEQQISYSCTYCRYKGECNRFQEVLANGLEPPKNEANFDNLRELGLELDKVNAIAKAMYSRKHQIEDSIKQLMFENDRMSYDGNGISVALRARSQSSFDSKAVVNELKDDFPEVLSEVANITKGRLEKKMKGLPIDVRDRLYRSMRKSQQNPSLTVNISAAIPVEEEE